MKSVMNHNFSQIPSINIPRSTFDRSHGLKTTFDAGKLYPFYVDEALPGDTFNLRHTIFSRLATPIAPIMDNLHQETFYFAVPMRLLWEHWQNFNGEYDVEYTPVDYLIPQLVSGDNGFESGSLSDYLGLPTKIPDLSVSCLYHRAYNLIWNEWFRDQNLQSMAVFNKGDGPDNVGDYPILPRGKRHDYFTSALPWPQKGPSVQIGMEDVNVWGNGKALTYSTDNGKDVTGFLNGSSGIGFSDTVNQILNTSPDQTQSSYATHRSLGFPNYEHKDDTYANLSNAFIAGEDLKLTVNALRQSFQLQKLFEKDARGGTRYTEILRSHFGVISPDARLQRPEYLGGSSARVNVVPVQQTSGTTATSPQGNLAAFGVTTDSCNGFNKSFTEHCLIIGLLNVRADLTYQHGIPRGFSRKTRFDFYWPSLAHLGEQEILNKEIFAVGSKSGFGNTDEGVFGYQERYAEYRYKPSQITGKMRSNAEGSLDVWHLSTEYQSLPALNHIFIADNPPVDRVIAVPSEPQFLSDIYIQLKCTRPMPTYSVPGLIDHF